MLVNVSQTMSLQYTPPEVSEDCLYLNVYAPAEAQRGDKLPVGLNVYSIRQTVCVGERGVVFLQGCRNTMHEFNIVQLPD